jgi:hypothetical protein
MQIKIVNYMLIALLYITIVDSHGLARENLYSEHREREGEALRALPVEGATQVPVIEWNNFKIIFIGHLPYKFTIMKSKFSVPFPPLKKGMVYIHEVQYFTHCMVYDVLNTSRGMIKGRDGWQDYSSQVSNLTHQFKVAFMERGLSDHED